MFVWVVLALPELLLLSLACGPKVWTLLNQPPLEAWDHGVSFMDSVAQPADRRVTSFAVFSCLRRRRMSPRHRRTGVDLQPRVKSRREVGNAPATLADEPAVHLGSSPPLSSPVLSCPRISHSILLAHCLILSRVEPQCRAVVSSTAMHKIDPIPFEINTGVLDCKTIIYAHHAHPFHLAKISRITDLKSTKGR